MACYYFCTPQISVIHSLTQSKCGLHSIANHYNAQFGTLKSADCLHEVSTWINKHNFDPHPLCITEKTGAVPDFHSPSISGLLWINHQCSNDILYTNRRICGSLGLLYTGCTVRILFLQFKQFYRSIFQISSEQLYILILLWKASMHNTTHTHTHLLPIQDFYCVTLDKKISMNTISAINFAGPSVGLLLDSNISSSWEYCINGMSALCWVSSIVPVPCLLHTFSYYTQDSHPVN